ncbi:MAG: DOMON-like domain-containing protein [Candidatus Electrothrix aestuarii]|uniref:DOMON-like domain-containing protein n=1 Tax=Candidatus Electrothrix aestuarii TaxID=3062594 RepID=A0AAU8LRY2_9BACT|nr:DOMON-like domain-containing protein [Candidatus Electrothrix aestuarii]
MEDLKKTTPFVLHPFQEQDFTSDFQLSGTLARSARGLQLAYELRGSVDEVLLPPAEAAPCRRDELWQASCFEFFVGDSGSPHYWEVNLAPSGDWNVYAFSGYRQGMQEEGSIIALPCNQQRQPTSYQLALDFPLARLIAPDQPIEVAVSVILQGHNGERAFYALTHCGPQPDFHLRESFLLRL